MSKAQRIRDLKAAGGSTYEAIAAEVGCVVGYVSAVLQRAKSGGYESAADRRYNKKNREKVLAYKRENSRRWREAQRALT